MKYFVSYFIKRDIITTGYGNAEIETDEINTYKKVKDIEQKIKDKFNVEQVSILNYIKLEKNK